MGDRRSYPGLLLLCGDPGGTVHDGHCDVLLRVPAGQLGPQHRDRGPSENSATATEYRSLNGYAARGRLTSRAPANRRGPGHGGCHVHSRPATLHPRKVGRWSSPCSRSAMTKWSAGARWNCWTPTGPPRSSGRRAQRPTRSHGSPCRAADVAIPGRPAARRGSLGRSSRSNVFPWCDGGGGRGCEC